MGDGSALGSGESSEQATMPRDSASIAKDTRVAEGNDVTLMEPPNQEYCLFLRTVSYLLRPQSMKLYKQPTPGCFVDVSNVSEHPLTHPTDSSPG